MRAQIDSRVKQLGDERQRKIEERNQQMQKLKQKVKQAFIEDTKATES